MNCGCENKKLSKELGRIRRLAVAFSKLENVVTIIYKEKDGSYDFCPIDQRDNKVIIEYITPY